MRLSTKIILSALVGSASLAAAVPAQAQYYQQRDRYDDRNDYRGDRYDDRYDRRGQANAIRAQIDQLAQRVDRIDRRDRISEREAAALRRDVRNLRQQYYSYSRNGLSEREFHVLQNRIHQVRQRLNHERRDRDGRRW
ncbi:hypothetical protein GRI40_11630 [Altererythrobacter aerius]|uniref:Uncharacterized protein n=1 Tax=Tsuneonella aeria TaxID=1837929 RepID=A0A6I4TGS5_9SPHN|nr:hypothetical protein [Tsuneonella aeria]MXO75866.1 hypothetical protein [Tsuneonella aeria]